MPNPSTAAGRFVRTLKRLFESNARYTKAGLARHCGHHPTWVPNLLKPRGDRPMMNLDDLIAIAGYFRMSVDAVLGLPTKAAELASDEQRLVQIWRDLSQERRDDLLALAGMVIFSTEHERLHAGLHALASSSTKISSLTAARSGAMLSASNPAGASYAGRAISDAGADHSATVDGRVLRRWAEDLDRLGSRLPRGSADAALCERLVADMLDAAGSSAERADHAAHTHGSRPLADPGSHAS